MIDIDRILYFLSTPSDSTLMIKNRLQDLEYNINEEVHKKNSLLGSLDMKSSEQLLTALKKLNQRSLDGYKNLIICKVLEDLSHENSK